MMRRVDCNHSKAMSGRTNELPSIYHNDRIHCGGRRAPPLLGVSNQSDLMVGLPHDHHASIRLLCEFDNVIETIDIPSYLTDHKTVLRFPEKLLLLIVEAEREALRSGCHAEEACLAWAADGRAVIVRNNDECIKRLISLASNIPAKFASFTRKLYRWGFRQVMLGRSTRTSRKEKVFWHPQFQRDNKPLMVTMKSITAEGTRKSVVSVSRATHQQHTAASINPLPNLSNSLQQWGEQASDQLLSVGNPSLWPPLAGQSPLVSLSAMASPQQQSLEQQLLDSMHTALLTSLGTVPLAHFAGQHAPHRQSLPPNNNIAPAADFDILQQVMGQSSGHNAVMSGWNFLGGPNCSLY